MIPYDKRSGKIWYNNELVDWGDVKLHVLSHGMHYASCVFEGERVYDGDIFKLEEHTARFFHSARRMGFEIPYSEEEINIDCKNLDLVLEAEKRPGHFNGVIFIVHKLFKITIPDRAYFGEKDWQQIQVIKRMAKDLSYRVEIKGCPIVRERDGLAMSSRNVYLTNEQRKEASNIPESLLKAHEKIKDGERQSTVIKGIISERLHRSSAIDIDYVELVNGENLTVTDQIDEQTRVLVAVRIGTARLIDNMNALEGLNL